jgi:hypothetical protein
MHASIHGTIGHKTNMVEKPHTVMLITHINLHMDIVVYWNNAHTLLHILLQSYVARSTD